MNVYCKSHTAVTHVTDKAHEPLVDASRNSNTITNLQACSLHFDIINTCSIINAFN